MPWRALVATMPLPELVARLVDAPREIEEAAGKLRCTPVRYLNVATKSSPKADFHWIYVPEEKYPFYRVGIYTNAVPAMAPPGRGSLYVELSDRGPMPRVDDIMPDVAQALAAAGAINGADDVLFAEIKELKYAYVVFDDNYYSSVDTVDPIFRIERRLSARPLRLLDLQRHGRFDFRRPRRRAKAQCVNGVADISASSSPSTTRRASCTRRWSISSPALDELEWDYEILLAENGSSDRTVAHRRGAVGEVPARVDPLAGRAQLRQGAAARASCARAASSSSATRSICATPTSTSARSRILEHDDADMVVGSKVMEGAEDRRPMMRHTATLVINGMLRVLVGFHGTDTHGLKAFRRERLLGTVERCELVARSVRLGVRHPRRARRQARAGDPDSHRREAAAVDQSVQARSESFARHRAADLYHPRQRLRGGSNEEQAVAALWRRVVASGGGAYAQKTARKKKTSELGQGPGQGGHRGQERHQAQGQGHLHRRRQGRPRVQASTSGRAARRARRAHPRQGRLQLARRQVGRRSLEPGRTPSTASGAPRRPLPPRRHRQPDRRPDGKGTITLETTKWTAGGGGVNDVIGHAIIVHGGVDDFKSQPAGNAGPRIGCGVIVK